MWVRSVSQLVSHINNNLALQWSLSKNIPGFFLTRLGINTAAPSPTAAFATPRTEHVTISTKAASTGKIYPTRTSSVPGRFLYTSISTTEGPHGLCPLKRCQNGGSCQQMKCICLEKFAGVLCEVYVCKLDNLTFFVQGFKNAANFYRLWCKNRPSKYLSSAIIWLAFGLFILGILTSLSSTHVMSTARLKPDMQPLDSGI